MLSLTTTAGLEPNKLKIEAVIGGGVGALLIITIVVFAIHRCVLFHAVKEIKSKTAFVLKKVECVYSQFMKNYSFI